MTLSVSGKVAIVTGAAHGIGLAIARHFRAKGARVMFADPDEAALIRELGEANDRDSTTQWLATDLRRKLDVSNLVAATLEAYGRIDILINAEHHYALSEPLSPQDDSTAELWAMNVQSALALTQQVARRMIEQSQDDPEEGPAGAVITLSSTAARRTQGELLAYAMANAALEQMTRSMAVALAPHRIRVNGIAFGSVMGSTLQATLKDHPEWREEIRQATPLGRIAAPSEVSEAAQFLASEGAGFVTGQILTIDGGRSLVDAARSSAH